MLLYLFASQIQNAGNECVLRKTRQCENIYALGDLLVLMLNMFDKTILTTEIDELKCNLEGRSAIFQTRKLLNNIFSVSGNLNTARKLFESSHDENCKKYIRIATRVLWTWCRNFVFENRPFSFERLFIYLFRKYSAKCDKKEFVFELPMSLALVLCSTFNIY